MHRRQFMTYASIMALLPVSGWAGDTNAHGFSFPNIDGGTLDLAAWKGRPIMVVNTASECGFTYQYDGLQALYDRYRDKGFVVLNVPSDDFGGQELDTEAEVKQFCEVNFALDMPMTNITKVRGRNRHPFYKWAQKVAGTKGAPRWNFHKILISHDGQFLDGYPSNVEPESPRILQAVDDALKAADAVSG